MKTLMILGGSILQMPAIIKAKKMGLKVAVVDMDENAIGFKYADRCVKISTTNIPAVVKVAREYKIDGIMTLASDMPIQTVAAVTKELNLVGISKDTALKATNKLSMRECLRDNNIPIPRFLCVKNIEEYKLAVGEFNGKFIVKPVDNSGSRGISLIDKDKNIDEYFYNAKKFSKSGDVLLEEYMEGPEVSVETLTVNGSTHVIAITDKITTGRPHFIEMGHSIPSSISSSMQEEVKSVAISAIEAIGINVGPSHTEIIITKDGPKIVELGARLGGDNITTHLVPLSTGIDMVKATILLSLGIYINILKNESKGAAIRYIKSTIGTISSVAGLDKSRNVNGVEEVVFLKNLGYKVSGLSSSNDRLGYVISSSNTAEEAIKICENAISMIDLQIII